MVGIIDSDRLAVANARTRGRATARARRLAFTGAGGRRLVGNRAGGVVTEFALILPMLLLFAFGIIQIGMLTYTYAAMQNSARNAARLMAFGANEATAVAAATAQLPPWVAGAASITPTARIEVVDAPDLARVQISAPGRTAAIIGYVPMPGTITADVTMPRVAER